MKRQFTTAAVLAVAATTLATGSATADSAAAAEYQFRVLGERSVDANTWLSGTRVGDLSGIDYHAATGGWYAVSDEATRRAPARFYRATLDITETGLGDVRFTGVSQLRQSEGAPYSGPGIDPEAIRVDPADGTVLWASEGTRRPSNLVDPRVRRAAADGAFVAEHPTATHLAMSAEQTGPRDGKALEGLTFNTAGTLAISAMEAPLIQDGGAVRFTFTNRTTGSVLTQLAYEPDARHGVSEILAVDASSYLVLERASLPDGQYSVRLFEASTAGARSVLPLASLADASYTPVTKRLLVDFGELGLSRVTNLEGMSWGPTLPSGERTLVLVSDNECARRTQFVALAVTLS